MPFYQYFNGSIFPVDAPLFKTSDLGLLRGYGVFDYFRTYNGRPFRWDDYWQRFRNSAAALRLEIPVDQNEAAGILQELYRLAGQKDLAFRFLLTGGYSPDSVSAASPNLLIRTEALPPDNASARANGIKVLPYSYVRDLAQVKTLNYLHMMLMAGDMQRRQASDLLFHHNNDVSELTRSNVFIIKGNSLITPGQNILPGITRRVVMELAAPRFDVQVQPVSLSELLSAEEVFTTSSTKMVLAITQVGDHIIGTGKPGPCTRSLQSMFEKMIENWGT